MNTSARFHMANLDEAGFEGEDVRVRQGERLRLALPGDAPIGPGAPAVAVDEEGEVGVVEQELAVQTLDVDGFGLLLARHKVEGGIGLVEQRLGLESLQADDLEAAGAGNAQLGLEEVDGGRLGGDVEFLRFHKIMVLGYCHFIITTTTHLERFQRILAALEKLRDGRLLFALGHGVHGLEDFDGGGEAGGLGRADEVPAQAHTCFEEVGVALDLLRTLEQRGLVLVGVKCFKGVGIEGLVCED